MTTDNKDRPAFPAKIHESERLSEYKLLGLTKREYFAAMAMKGILANTNTIERGISSVLNGNSKCLASHVSGMAVEYADELLKQLGE